MEYPEKDRDAGAVAPGLSGDATRGAAGAVKDEVQRLANDARQGTTQVAERAKEQVASTATESKEEAAQRLGNLASAFRDAGQQLDTGDAAFFGRYAGVAADELEKLSAWLRNRDMRDLVRDTETFARRHPDLFIGGAFVAGMAISRFLKSSTPEEASLEPSPMTTSAPMMADEVRTFTPASSPEPLRTDAARFGYSSPGTSAYSTGDRTGAFGDLNVPAGPNARPDTIGELSRSTSTSTSPATTNDDGEGGL
jgi:hypothetical protein